MRFCPSFQIVQLMHEGMKAQEACNTVVERMLRQSGQQFEVAVIALDTKVSTSYYTTTTVFYTYTLGYANLYHVHTCISCMLTDEICLIPRPHPLWKRGSWDIDTMQFLVLQDQQSCDKYTGLYMITR